MGNGAGWRWAGADGWVGGWGPVDGHGGGLEVGCSGLKVGCRWAGGERGWVGKGLAEVWRTVGG